MQSRPVANVVLDALTRLYEEDKDDDSLLVPTLLTETLGVVLWEAFADGNAGRMVPRNILLAKLRQLVDRAK